MDFANIEIVADGGVGGVQADGALSVDFDGLGNRADLQLHVLGAGGGDGEVQVGDGDAIEGLLASGSS